MTKKEIQDQIDKLEKALKSPAMNDDFRDSFQEKIDSLKKQLEKAEAKPESKTDSKKSSGMIKIKKITILWAEGDQSKYPEFPQSYTTWKAANDVIKIVYDDFAELDAGGYSKVKFQLEWEDGEDYEGRLDVSEKEDNPYKSSNVIGQHVADFLTYLATDENSKYDKVEVLDFLAKYDLGLEKKQSAKPAETKKEEVKPKMTVVQNRKKSVPLPENLQKKDEYDCDELIKKAKERKAKAKARAAMPKKTDATKNKEKIENVFENVQDRIKSDDVTKAELIKLIKETEQLLKVLKDSLAKLK